MGHVHHDACNYFLQKPIYLGSDGRYCIDSPFSYIRYTRELEAIILISLLLWVLSGVHSSRSSESIKAGQYKIYRLN